MLEAFDVAGSLRGTGELAGVSHHTVARYVAERDAGELAGDGPRRRGRIIDPFFGEDRGVGRAVARQDPRRSLPRQAEGVGVRGFGPDGASGGGGGEGQPSPWSAAGVSAVDPRAWDVGAVGLGHRSGRRTNLFCAWLAWSRFRVVVPCWDRRLATVIGYVDRVMRAFGGAPTYWLTDNERTVTIDHVAGVPVRHPEMVAVGGHYGITIATCVPADPESKGGAEATVRVAKADLVPPTRTCAAATPAGPSWSMRARHRWPRSTAVSIG